MKKVIPVLIGAVLVYFLVTDYSGTTAVFYGIGHGVAKAAKAVIRFAKGFG